MPVFETRSPEETEQLGARLGAQLTAGDLITLAGPLGGGKTCFVRGLVYGAAPDCADQVASPTYALLHQYPGHPPIYHLDCYRLRGADDARESGLLDILSGDGICLVEWPERIAAELPAERLEIRFDHLTESCRRISLFPHGRHARALAEQLRKTS